MNLIAFGGKWSMSANAPVPAQEQVVAVDSIDCFGWIRQVWQCNLRRERCVGLLWSLSAYSRSDQPGDARQDQGRDTS